MFDPSITPVIFAHRGACASAPENTLASFELAVKQLADAVELDAKLSKDGQVVVIHDPTVDRTTNGSGSVNRLTLAELKTLDAGGKFDPKYKGEKIPTLDEVFESVGGKVFVNVELTNYKSSRDALIEKTARIVKNHKMEARVIFSSFLPKNLIAIRKLLPDTLVGLLCLEGAAGLLSRSFFFRKVFPLAIHPYLADVSGPYVANEHKNKRRVHVWTVNEENDLKRLAEIGVDGIFTDDPMKARRILGRE
ncbi:MAG: glycerophosphodiester phosphodiesterase family protein [Chloroflexi bacterium]|nr:glycerophosphodiester phosphodiesterase family protein [Chloroflexota bacterium]